MPTQQTETCADCAKPITGTPYVWEEQVLCAACWQKRQWLNSSGEGKSDSRTLCGNCDAPIGRLETPYRSGVNNLCETCFRRLSPTAAIAAKSPDFVALQLAASALSILGGLEVILAVILAVILFIGGRPLFPADVVLPTGVFTSGIVLLGFGELLSAVRHIARKP